MISLVKPLPVTAGGAQWPVLFTFRAWWELSRLYGGMEAALEAGSRIDQAMAGRFFWAGLLHDSPDLTIETVTGMLDESDLAELDQLPLDLVEAVRVSSPERQGDGEGGGDPWDWDQARAVWATEWGQHPDDFWRLTFRDFASYSDGRSKLYKAAQKDASNDKEPVDVEDPRDLIRNQRLRR
jgi:hypothetical protein